MALVKKISYPLIVAKTAVYERKGGLSQYYDLFEVSVCEGEVLFDFHEPMIEEQAVEATKSFLDIWGVGINLENHPKAIAFGEKIIRYDDSSEVYECCEPVLRIMFCAAKKYPCFPSLPKSYTSLCYSHFLVSRVEAYENNNEKLISCAYSVLSFCEYCASLVSGNTNDKIKRKVMSKVFRINPSVLKKYGKLCSERGSEITA